MGCTGSRIAGPSTGGVPTVDRRTYYQRHPGLHNIPTHGIESELTHRTRAAPDAADKDTIQVTKLDLNVRQNAKAHHTNEFDITDALVYDSREELVIRRGQIFNINIEFNRLYDSAKDDLRLVFQFGKRPLPSRGTHVEFMLSDRDVPKEWGAFIQSKEGNSLSIDVVTAADCAVGKWSIKIDVVKRTDSSTTVYRYTHSTPIYILFNPWCKDDLVYMYEDNQLEEYILNETGKIYAGTRRKITPKPWVFGQFTGDVLDCVMHILDISGLPDHSRGNPVAVVRKISAFVNAADDSGVLVGNWSGVYTGGTSPLDWTGSVAILDEYYRTKKPVQFGQCWVFSGVVTTICRALGIPARSVTNYASAHDTDGSITIDVHYDHKRKPLREFDEDSIWNFHVWNDVWMARPDLPAGYGGWQAIDATPQETSEGIFQMGPASLLAIKRGEVQFAFDGPFAFAEVNADKVYWMMDLDGYMNKVYVKKFGIGRYISTKGLSRRGSGSDSDREDITDQYKYKEGTDEERAAVRRANVHSTREGLYETKALDVTFDLCSDPNTFIGDTVKFCLKVKNNSTSKRTVNGTIVLSSTYYTGVAYKDVKEHDIDKTVLAANEEKSIDVNVEVTDYLDKLTDHCICQISCLCLVDETKQTFAETEELRLRKPHLTIQAPETAIVGQKFEVEVSFENPLPVTLTKCELRVEGPGIQRPVIFKQPNVAAKQTFTGKIELNPVKPGSREIIVYFNCAQISSVNVAYSLNIYQ